MEKGDSNQAGGEPHLLPSSDGGEYGPTAPFEETEWEGDMAESPAESLQGSNEPYSLVYRSWEEAEDAKRIRINAQIFTANEEGGGQDAPSQPEIQMEYIQRLFDAINAVETTGPDAIVDKPAKEGGLAQGPKKFKNKKYPGHAIEEVCWEIFRKASIAQMDIKLIESWHCQKPEPQARYNDFDDRWDYIVDGCRKSKALCKMLLDPHYVDRFVSNPKGEFKMKLSNKKINAQRDEQNEIGRKFVKHQLTKHHAEDYITALKGEEALGQEDDMFNSDNLPLHSPVQEPVTPKTRGNPARRAINQSSKRKKTSDTNSAGDDDDDDDDDDYVDSAFRSGMRSTGRPGRGRVVTLPTPSKEPASARSSTRKRRQPLRRGSSARPLVIAAPQDIQGRNHTEDYYKSVLFQLLGVDGNDGNLYALSLQELRVYARAYNSKYNTFQWTLPGWRSCTVHGYSVTDNEKNIHHEHFALVYRILLPLAVARGDLYIGGQLKPAGNKTFSTDHELHEQALGIRRNAYGLFTAYPAPQPTSQLAAQSQFELDDSYSQEAHRQHSSYSSASSRQPIAHMSSYAHYQNQNNQHNFDADHYNHLPTVNPAHSGLPTHHGHYAHPSFERQNYAPTQGYYTPEPYQGQSNTHGDHFHGNSNYNGYRSSSAYQDSDYPDPGRFSSERPDQH